MKPLSVKQEGKVVRKKFNWLVLENGGGRAKRELINWLQKPREDPVSYIKKIYGGMYLTGLISIPTQIGETKKVKKGNLFKCSSI